MPTAAASIVSGKKPGRYRVSRADTPRARDLYQQLIKHEITPAAYMGLLYQQGGGEEWAGAPEDEEKKPTQLLALAEEEEEEEAAAAREPRLFLDHRIMEHLLMEAFLVEAAHDVDDHHRHPETAERKPEAAVAVYTDPKSKTAHVYYPEMLDDHSHDVHAVLPEVEKHAARSGAKEITLLVNASKADILADRHGYEHAGRPVTAKNGLRLQPMKKTLDSDDENYG